MTEATPDKGSLPTVRQQLQLLETEMRAIRLWSAQPPSAEAMASTMPFMYDTLRVEQWLQWVFVPRLHALLDAGQPLPGNCHVQPLAEYEWAQRLPATESRRVLAVLLQIDDLLNAGAPPATN